MIEIPGYQIVEPLYESGVSTVHRARCLENGRPVVIKALKRDFLSTQEMIRYKHEYEIMKSLEDLPGVLTAYRMDSIDNQLFLVLEDVGGQSLRFWMSQRPFELGEALSLGVEVARILGQLNTAQVIHKSVNPSNLVLNPATGALRLIDFGISSALSREVPPLLSAEALEGDLGYISPEQTGRMNRSVDYRTDFYSLGVTLYELLTGRLPFSAEDRMELVHCHIAKIPVAPAELAPKVPKTVSDIVMKLLSKSAERRYQSAKGIASDLGRCLEALSQGAAVSPFALGENDAVECPRLPQKLYGRETELAILLAGLKRVCEGNREVTLITGRSGIGKTSLVQEVHGPMTSERGHFVSGRFSQFQSGSPYPALSAALQQLVRYLLTEDESTIASWREKLQRAVGNHGRVLGDLIPELTLILGPQPEPDPLPPLETKNRIGLLMQQFLQVFAQPTHPLILFLDDMQWADGDTLKLLSFLMTSPDIRSLYLIGAYRDSEIGLTHPLLDMLGELRAVAIPIKHLSLSPLSKEQVSQLIGDTIGAPPDTTAELAQIVLKTTHGVPFFVNELLSSLFEKKLIRFRPGTASWVWDPEEIEASTQLGDVTELLKDRIQKLPETTQDTLKSAAIMGVLFDLRVLSILRHASPKETLEHLLPALQESLVIPLSEGYRAIAHDAPVGEEPIEFKFVHDRVQQAVYALIEEDKRPAIHQEIGELLLSNFSKEQREPRMFDIVNHFNRAIVIIEERGERDSLAELNLMAGKKAMASAAYRTALGYFETGLMLLADTGWETKYATSLELHLQEIEAAYLCAEFGKVEGLAEAVDRRVKDPQEKARAAKARIDALNAQQRPADAIKVGLAFLRELSVRIPERPGRLSLIYRYALSRLAFLYRGPEAILSLPEMRDPRRIATLQVLRSMAVSIYVTNPKLMAWTLFYQVRLATSASHSLFSPSIFASFSIVLCGVIGDIETGYQVGKLALRLLEGQRSSSIKGRVIYLFNVFSRHWKEHLDQTLESLLQAYQASLSAGDFEYAALNCHHYCHHSFFLGIDLAVLDREFGFYRDIIQRLNQKLPLGYQRVFHQAVANLLGRSQNPVELTGEFTDEKKHIEEMERSADRAGLYCYYFLKLYLCCLFKRYREALSWIQSFARKGEAPAAMFGLTRSMFMEALARLGVFAESSEVERRQIKASARRTLKALTRYAKHCPKNHLHLQHLLEAEIFRVQGDEERAADRYEKAISLAKQNGFIHEEALALELSGLFFLRKGDEPIAAKFLQNARHAYFHWGAIRKVKEMDEEHGLLFARKQAQSSSSTAKPASLAFSQSSPSLSTLLDLDAVMKAAQGISSEIELDRVLEKLMTIVIENAGADKACLLLEKDGHLMVEALSRVAMDHSIETNQASLPLGKCEEVASGIIRYTLRTRESVVLGDAANEGAFTHDPYVQRTNVKSLLCIPLMRHSNPIGILYLENNQSQDTFTAERVELLRLIASQAAIAIDNALLYKNLKVSRELLQHALTEAEESVRIKNEFLSRTTHELRTPLNAIINIPEGLLEQYEAVPLVQCEACASTFELDAGESMDLGIPCPQCKAAGHFRSELTYRFTGDNKEAYALLRNVTQSGRALLDVVNNILEISTLEAGKMVRSDREIQVSQLVQQTIDAL